MKLWHFFSSTSVRTVRVMRVFSRWRQGLLWKQLQQMIAVLLPTTDALTRFSSLCAFCQWSSTRRMKSYVFKFHKMASFGRNGWSFLEKPTNNQEVETVIEDQAVNMVTVQAQVLRQTNKSISVQSTKFTRRTGKACLLQQSSLQWLQIGRMGGILTCTF